MRKERCALLFSGGLDSSFCACLLVEKGYDLDLIHCFQGSLITHDLFRIRAEEITNIYRSSDIHLHNLPTYGSFRKIALSSLEEDIPEYKVSLVCLGCKLAMHCEVISFCLSTGITTVADGANKRQEKYAEQSRIAIDFLKQLYASYGIQYLTPVYYLEKPEIKYGLLDRGITIQPLEDTCIFSHTFSKADDDTIALYLQKKKSICKEIIERRTKMNAIDKVGGIILKDKKLLVVKKRTKENREEYIIPGGKREGNETDFQTLARELKEEIQVDLVNAAPFGGFDDIAVFENIPIHIEVYYADIAGTPCCDSEIKDLVWIDRDYEKKGIKLGSVLGKFVVPGLVEKGLM